MSKLKDPGETRIVKEHPPPFQISINQEQLFQGKKIDEELLNDFLSKEGKLSKHIVQTIIRRTKTLLQMQPNVLAIRDPVYIVGDIHGQFYDLINLLSRVSQPGESKVKLLFLGDYVDRGNFSIEVLITILVLKINYPKYVFMLRGNHECRQLTTFFNFRNQCLQYYNQEVYEEFIQLFETLPLAAIINKSIFCVHGGISPNLSNVEDIMKINRFQQIPFSGLFCDLLWSDPVSDELGKLEDLAVFNEQRNCSYNFGYQLAKSILSRNNWRCIIRAHEAKEYGYQMHHWAGRDMFPPIITIFSAPHYCDFYNNKGGLLFIDKNQLEITQLDFTQHPFYLPNNQCLFEWSIPFLAEKVTQMFFYLLHDSGEDKKQQLQHHQISQLSYPGCSEQNDKINIFILDRAKIIDELLHIQMEEVEENIELMKIYGNGNTLGEQLAMNQEARSYTTNLIETTKKFSLQKLIDRINQSRPTEDSIHK